MIELSIAFSMLGASSSSAIQAKVPFASPQAEVQNCALIEMGAPPHGGTTAGWVEIGDCLARDKRWLEAEAAYRNALRIDPALTAAAVGHARALMALGEAATASVELEQFTNQHPEAVPALELYAQWLAERWDDKKEAARLLEQCSRLTPSNVEIWRHLGDLRFQLDLLPEAMSSYQVAQQLTPRDPRLEVGVGRCLEFLDRPTDAQQAFERALALNRKGTIPQAEVHSRYAEFLYRQNRYADSATAYSDALAIDPRSADAYMGRALALAKLKDYVRAEQDALKVLKFGGERVDAHELLLRLYRATNAPEKARLHADQITKLQAAEEERQARDRQMRQLLREGKPLMAQGKYAEAAPRFEQILRLAPENAEAYFALAVCYSQMGRTDEAIVLLRRYLERRPTQADGYTVLGLLLLDRGQSQDARQALERALELDPAQEEARQALHSLAPATSKP
jgi:tetratricopeptide (TPR) repeat protein